MHELSIMTRILEIVIQQAETHGVRKVRAIDLEVGMLSDLEAQWMQHYFFKYRVCENPIAADIHSLKVKFYRETDLEIFYRPDLQGVFFMPLFLKVSVFVH